MAEKNNKKGRVGDLSIGGFVLRLFAAFVLVAATYNPTQKSFVNWVQTGFADGTLGPEHLLAGIVLVIGWTVFVVASVRSLGMLGLVLGAVLLGAIVWFLIDLGILTAATSDSIVWISLVCLAALLAIGMSWSHLWRRITGQLEVDTD